MKHKGLESGNSFLLDILQANTGWGLKICLEWIYVFEKLF